MKKRYKFILSKWYYLLFAAAAIALTAAETVNILRLCNVGNMQSYNYPLDITACVIMPLLTAMIATFVFCSGYTLTDSGVRVNLGIFFTSIPYEHILRLRRDEGKTIMIMYYAAAVKDKTDEAVPAWQVKQINIKPQLYDEFAAAITDKCNAEYDVVETGVKK